MDPVTIPNPQPLYPEQIACAAPLGTRARLRRAAEQSGETVASFVRSAIEDRLRQASTVSGAAR